MSAMTNDPFKLARMAGYYKGVQSAGAAVSFGMDAVKVSWGFDSPSIVRTTKPLPHSPSTFSPQHFCVSIIP
jgi:hypothetical protein